MNIGKAAKLSGVSAKMIRHYEEMGILPKSKRTESGYRQYSEKEVHLLIFIRRSRDLGFSSADIKKLMNLWLNKKRSSSEVKKLAVGHIQTLEAKLQQIQQLVNTLKILIACCHGDERPDCPILEALSD